MTGLRTRLRDLLRRGSVERELDDEVRFHVEMETERYVREGHSPAEARRRALVDFGGVERFKEACRDEQGARAFADLGRDLRQAARSLRRSPGFAAAAVLTLGLGVGAATTVFSVVDGVLLRPLVYPGAERILSVFEAQPAGAVRSASYPTFREWERRPGPFQALAWARGENFVVRGPEGPQRYVGAFVTEGFFRVMGTPPLLGRTPAPGAARELALSYALWNRAFGRDPAVIGRTLPTPGGPFTVVGVMPQGFATPFWAEVWTSVGSLPPELARVLDDPRLHADSEVLGRLAPGVTREVAQSRMDAVVRATSGDAEWSRAALFSVRESLLGTDVPQRLTVLGGAVALVLLLACANVANLLLARASARRRELAIRTALGAGRGRLVRQLLAEGALVGAAGGAVGAAAAVAGVRFLRAAAPDALPRMDEVAVDGRVLAFAVGVSLLTTLLFGLAPALRGSRGDLAGALRGGGRGGVDRGTARGRAALVVLEVALALVLVAGAGLLLRGLGRLQSVDPGFDGAGVMTLRVYPPEPRYSEGGAALELYRRVHQAAASTPGVRAAALANHIPMAGGAAVTRVVTGGPVPPQGDRVLLRTVSPEYFGVVRTRLLSGRLLATQDLAGPGGGVVVNRTLARAFWPGADPVGRPLTVTRAAQGRPGVGDPMPAVVVGVVEDERYSDLATDPPPAVFVPYTWDPWTHIVVLARGDGDPEALVPVLRRAVLAVEPEIPVGGTSTLNGFHSLDALTARTLVGQRLNALLLGSFALSALLLAAVGIFGVMAYVVSQRTPEIGVRVALGARPADVAWWVTRQTLRLAGAGMVLGAIGALAAAPILRSQLYGVSAADPAVLMGVAAVFGAVSLLAGYLPARRASRVPPITALRAE